ncbi:MAG: adenine phosphoribosyltransferase [Clostridiales bacterium]|jgi:adenine phosphoribosyltransferase|nr:adenine phosphoribosyltransferase [Clostridiales bacterium]
MSLNIDLKNIIRSIPDFPEKGVIFRDITPILSDPAAFKFAIEELQRLTADLDFDIILGAESRGFIFGAPFAIACGKGFVPVRKPGKLPYEKISKSYDLEYGSSTLEIHADALRAGQKVLILDDLLATGGTARAIAELVSELGARVSAMAFVVELAGLGGREKCAGFETRSLIAYE